MLLIVCGFIQFHFILLWLKVSSLGCRAEHGGGWIGCDAYQGACDVDAAIADARVIQPFWLGEAEESVV